MEQHVAAEHLQVIRTLMERSALYRRRLAPILLYAGSIGCLAAAGGVAFRIEALRPFCAWWLVAALTALAGVFVIARRQADDDGERFWSPPALRVTQALLPPLAAGLILSLALAAFGPQGSLRWPLESPLERAARGAFVLGNALFYACAVHAAGFFLPRGMKLFGWLLIAVSGVALLVRLGFAGSSSMPDFPAVDHLLMGGLFGVAHLAYGAYLYATEPRKTAA